MTSRDADRSLDDAKRPFRAPGFNYARSPLRLLVVAAALALTTADNASAQRRNAPANRALRQRAEQAQDTNAPASVLIETSPSLANLLSRAEEGIARRDWKFAIDSLQRVIDHTDGSLVTRSDGAVEGGELFESARRVATKRLATMPPDGLRAYRMLYDGKAFGLLERAKADHDPATLRLITQRYLLTRHGDDAAELLASWNLDDGRAGEALALLADIAGIVPDTDIPEGRLAAKTAAAYALLGRSKKAAETIANRQSAIGDSDSTPEWHNRLAELAPVSRRAGRNAWDMPESLVKTTDGLALGSPSVMPSLLESTPWRYELPGSAAGLWRRIYDDDPSDPPIIAVGELASDGQRLFVRKPGGCAAIEVDDLSPIWESSWDFAARAARREREAWMQRLSRVIAGHQADLPRDDAVAMIAHANDLIFVIESEGQGKFVDHDKVAAPQLFPGLLQPRATRVSVTATRLVAHDARTGDIHWQRGRTDSPDDLLGNVRFRSTPIMVDDALWVPYIANKDLFVAVLRPEDGSLIHNLLLGSVSRLTSARRLATPLSYADETVYIPSGYGVLFAVDASDFMLRWATRYRSEDGDSQTPSPDDVYPWISSPPVVAGGIVILAATDAVDLLAFSATDGEYLWSVQSKYTSFVIAADHSRIWLGGRGVSCLSVADGSRIWRTHVPAVPTGRGTLSGEVIHLPTSEGLVTLDAASGRHIQAQALASSQTPLGNLACVGSALFSLDPTSIRKFPDLERMLTAATAAAKADPTNARAAIRLAWAELLAGEPQRALEVIGRTHAADGDGRRSRALARVRLEALLALAKLAGDDHPQGLKLLQEANEVATTPGDRLRCGRLIADRQRAMGNQAQAYETLLLLGLGPEADETVSVDGSVRVTSRLLIAEDLRQLRGELPDRLLKKIDADMDTRVADAARRLTDESEVELARAQLHAIAELQTVGSSATNALLALADWELTRERYERTERYLSECILRNPASESTIPARTRLCDLYSENTQAVPGLLSPCLDELQERFGSTWLPGDDHSQRARRSDSSQQEDRRRVSDWVAEVRSKIPSPQDGAYQRPVSDSDTGDRGDTPGLTGERAWSFSFGAEGGSLRFVSFPDRERRGLDDRVIAFGARGEIECLDATTGVPHWKTKLRLPETFNESPRRRGSMMPVGTLEAVVDGQVAVFDDVGGLFAVGLVTGRRLWVRPYEIPVDGMRARRANAAMTAGDGFLAAMPRDGHLTLMRMLDGTTVWERDLRSEPVAALWMRSDCVVTADAALERVHVFGRRDGHLIGQVLFSQPDPNDRLVRLVWTGDTLCGPDSTAESDAVVAVNIEDGASAWRVEVNKPLVQLFEAQEGYVGVGLLGGDVWIIDASTGEVVLEQQVASISPVTDGLFTNGTLVVQTETTQGQRTFVDLTAFDVATGEEIWEREDIVPFLGSPPPLRVLDGTVPVLIASRKSNNIKPGGIVERTSGVALAMIDLDTGLNAGPAIDLPSSNSGTQMKGDMIIGSSTLIVGTTNSIQAFVIAPVKAEPQRDFQ